MNLIQRLGLAAKMLTKGGAAELAYFRQKSKEGSGETASDPYSQVIAVFRCVQFLTDSVASLPFYVSTDDDRIIESGPIAEIIDNPNPMMGMQEFWRQSVGWLLLTGNLYWLFPEKQGDKPTSIVPVGAGQCKPKVAKDSGELIGWQYRPSGMRWDQAITLDPNDVWAVRTSAFNANDPYAGVSVIEVVRKAVAQVFKADVANEAALDNGLEPSGLFVMKSRPNQKEVEHMREQLHDRHAGAKNRKRHMMLYGDMDWKTLGSSFKDMDFKELKTFSRDDICAGFGIDPCAVGYPPTGGRFEYAKAAIDNAWISRVIPLAGWLASEWQRGILTHYESDRSIAAARAISDAKPARRVQRMFRATGGRGGNLSAWFDYSNINATRELLKSRIEMAATMVKSLKASPEEANDLLDLGLEGNYAQKLVWVGVGEMPYTEAVSQPDMPEDPEPDPLKQLTELVKSGNWSNDQLETVNRATEEKLSRLNDAWQRSWQPLAKKMQGRVRSHLMDLRKEMLRNIERAKGWQNGGTDTRSIDLVWHDEDGEHRGSFDLSMEQRDIVTDIIFDITAANGKLLGKIRPLMRGSLMLGGEQSVQEASDLLGEDVNPFAIEDADAVAALTRRDVNIVGINQRAAQRMRVALSESLADGATLEQLSDVVRATSNLEASRANLIANQETASAVEEGRQIGRDQAGVPMKSWLWSRKETGRENHAATERAYMDTPAQNDEAFNIANTPHSCMYPRGSGIAEEDINCGCTSISRYQGDGLAKSIDTLERRGFIQASERHGL